MAFRCVLQEVLMLTVDEVNLNQNYYGKKCNIQTYFAHIHDNGHSCISLVIVYRF